MDLLIERIFHLICKSRRVGYVCHFVADVSDGACLQGSICRWFGRRQDLRHLSVLSQLIPNEFYRYNRCVCTVMQHVDLTRIYDAELFGGGVPCPLGINKWPSSSLCLGHRQFGVNATTIYTDRPNSVARCRSTSLLVFLWPPYGIGQAIIFLPCDFYLSSSSSFFRT